MPLPRMLPTATATGPASVLIRGPGIERQVRARALAQQDRNVVGAAVGDDQVGLAVEVGDRDPDRVGSHVEAIPVVERRAELAVAQAGVNQHVVRPAVGDDQVGDAVAGQVGQRHGPGIEQSGGLVGQHGGLAGAVLDDHAIEPLVGVDEVGLAVAGQIGHRQRHVLVGLAIGAEGAVAVALQDEQIAVRVADQEVGDAVAIDIGDRQAVGLGPRVVAGEPGNRPGRCPA